MLIKHLFSGFSLPELLLSLPLWLLCLALEDPDGTALPPASLIIPIGFFLRNSSYISTMTFNTWPISFGTPPPSGAGRPVFASLLSAFSFSEMPDVRS